MITNTAGFTESIGNTFVQILFFIGLPMLIGITSMILAAYLKGIGQLRKRRWLPILLGILALLLASMPLFLAKISAILLC